VYALGVVLYELVTGQVPFNAPTPLMLLLKHIYESPPAPRSLNPNLPAPLEAAVLRALAKEPHQRYQSAAEMSAALERLIEQLHRPTAQVALGSAHDSAASLDLSHEDQLKLDDTIEVLSHAGETRGAIVAADDQITQLTDPNRSQTVQANGRQRQRNAAQRPDIGLTPRYPFATKLIRSGRKVASLIGVAAALMVLVGAGSALPAQPIPTPALAGATAPELLVVTSTPTSTPTDVPTATPTSTATWTAMATATATATAMATSTATSTPTNLPTATAAATATPKPKPRPKPTATPLPTEAAPAPATDAVPPAPTEPAPVPPTEAAPAPTATPRKEHRHNDSPPKPPAP